MLDETFKRRIYNSLADGFPITFMVDDAGGVYHTVTYTPSIDRFRDTNPAAMPSIILEYNGGYPLKAIGSQDMFYDTTDLDVGSHTADVADYTLVRADTAYASKVKNTKYFPFAVDGSTTVEFTITPKYKTVDKIQVYTSLPTNSTSELICEVLDEEGVVVVKEIVRNYEVTASGYTTVLSSAIELGERQTTFTVRLRDRWKDSMSLGVNIYKDSSDNVVYKTYMTTETSQYRGYQFRERLTITIQAINDETQSVPVQGYLIVDEIYRFLIAKTIDWDSFPEGDVKLTTEPVRSVDDSHVHTFIHTLTFDAIIEYWAGITDVETLAPLLERVTLDEIELV